MNNVGVPNTQSGKYYFYSDTSCISRSLLWVLLSHGFSHLSDINFFMEAAKKALQIDMRKSKIPYTDLKANNGITFDA